jgi:isoaspartyl peptidase/L-asparaginase-like protein (Ntn-hydrolase superfamily)
MKSQYEPVLIEEQGHAGVTCSWGKRSLERRTVVNDSPKFGTGTWRKTVAAAPSTS